MPKYLVAINYTAEGAKGVSKEGGSARRDVARQLIESLGGRLESFYFAFGSADAYAIADMPSAADAAAVALTVAAAGGVATTTTVLITAEEVDEAARKSVQYRPPGA